MRRTSHQSVEQRSATSCRWKSQSLRLLSGALPTGQLTETASSGFEGSRQVSSDDKMKAKGLALVAWEGFPFMGAWLPIDGSPTLVDKGAPSTLHDHEYRRPWTGRLGNQSTFSRPPLPSPPFTCCVLYCLSESTKLFSESVKAATMTLRSGVSE